MIDINYILFGLFVLGMALFLRKHRKYVQVQKILYPLIYFVMYRTTWGLDWMDRTAKKHPVLLRWLFSVGVIIGFLGMALISFELISVTVKLVTQPEAPIAIQPVLPIDIQGVYYVPFVYWIIAIFIIALVHEFAHGVAARLYKIPLKSSGFAFVGLILPIIPAAFVEPDEKRLPKHKAWEQLSVFAAGPLANILTAIIVVIISAVLIAPISNILFTQQDIGFLGIIPQQADNGIKLSQIVPGSAAEKANLQAGEIIIKLNDQEIATLENFRDYLATKKPGDELKVITDKNAYTITLGKGSKNIAKYTDGFGNIITKAFGWFVGLLAQLYLLSLGIGLFNLVPIGPIDGGRMFRTAMSKLIPSKAQNVCSVTSSILVFLIFFHLVRAFIG